MHRRVFRNLFRRRRCHRCCRCRNRCRRFCRTLCHRKSSNCDERQNSGGRGECFHLLSFSKPSSFSGLDMCSENKSTSRLRNPFEAHMDFSPHGPARRRRGRTGEGARHRRRIEQFTGRSLVSKTDPAVCRGFHGFQSRRRHQHGQRQRAPRYT